MTELIVDSEHKTAPKAETGHPLVRTSDIKRGRIELSKVQRVNEETYEKWTRRAVPEAGDLILAREAPVGNVAVVTEGMRPVLGQRTVLLRPDRTCVDPTFLCALLLGDEAQYWMNAVANGSTVPHLNMSDIRALKLPELPDLATQRRIGAAIASFDDLIENNRRRIEILEEMARLLYREWFVHLRFPGHEDVELVDSELGPIPEGWEVVQLGAVVTLSYGKALKADDRSGGLVEVYGSGGVVGHHDTFLIEGPGIVVGRKGNVGALYWSDVDFFPIDTTYYVVTDLPLHFVFQMLGTLTFIDSHAAVPGLSRDQAYGLPVVVPRAALAQQYEERATPMVQLRRNLIEQNRVLRETRDLLLPRLVAGELDVSELDLDGVLA